MKCGGIPQIDKQILPPQTGLYSMELFSNFNQICWRYYCSFFRCDTVGFSRYIVKFWRNMNWPSSGQKNFGSSLPNCMALYPKRWYS